MTAIVIWAITALAIGPPAFYSGYWFGRFAEARYQNTLRQAAKESQ